MDRQPVEFSIPLRRSLNTRIYIHLTVQAKSILVFLTTASADELNSVAPMGSFVYAIPDKLSPSQPLSTSLLTVEPTIELTNRLAKLIARRTGLPTYVGNSMFSASAGLGGTKDEEMDAFNDVTGVVLERLRIMVLRPFELQPDGVES